MAIGKLEPIGIKKRKSDFLANTTKEYGVEGDLTNGYDPDNEYDIHGANSKKGTESGYLSDHINSTKFDFTKGGSKIDKENRERQQGYQVDGINKYSPESIYSDADDTRIDTSGNIGQVKIY